MGYYRELHHFARKALRGRYPAAWVASMLPLLLRFSGLLAPAMFGAYCIRKGVLQPAELFTGRLWALTAALWGLLTFCIRIPVQCGTRSWFTSLTELERPGQARCFFPTAKRYFHALYFFGTVALVRFLAALPAAAACTGTLWLLRKSSGMPEGGLWLFAAVQGLAAVFWTVVWYLRFCVSLAAVPHLYLSDPHRGVLRTIRDSRRMLHGHCRRLIAVALPYAPAALPLVTIPFLLPCLVTDLTIFLQLRIREYEQADRRYPCLN